MKFFRIMYLDDNNKRKRLIIETTDLSKAVLKASMILSNQCSIISFSEISARDVQKFELLKRKEVFYSKTVVIIPKKRLYPEILFEKEAAL